MSSTRRRSPHGKGCGKGTECKDLSRTPLSCVFQTELFGGLGPFVSFEDLADLRPHSEEFNFASCLTRSWQVGADAELYAVT